MMTIEQKEIINELVDTINDEYVYHSKILNALEEWITTGKTRTVIISSSNSTVYFDENDWPLALSMCERYFKKNSYKRNRILELKREIQCFLEKE